MKRLIFIRTAKSFHSWDYYETKTSVYVFGNVAGFDYFCERLLAAKRARRNVRLTLSIKRSFSMQVVILPANASGVGKPRLKFIERLVFLRSRPFMELVIYGNKKGYDYLAGLLKVLRRDAAGNISEHVELDDTHNRYIVPRSVSLSIRAPLVTWNRRNLSEYQYLVCKRSPNFLPTDVDYLLSNRGPYERIAAADSDFLRLR